MTAKVRINLFFATIIVTGLLLPVAAGILARMVLESRGVAVVDWGRGVQLMIPLGLLFASPFILFAFYVRKKMLEHLEVKTEPLAKWFHIYAASFLALLAWQGYGLLGAALYSGPGGFANVVIMMLAMWMLTIPYMFATCAGACVIGGAIGLGYWNWRSGKLE